MKFFKHFLLSVFVFSLSFSVGAYAQNMVDSGDNIVGIWMFSDDGTQILTSDTVDIDLAGNNIDEVGYVDYGEITTPSAPADNFGRMYAKDFGGVTNPYWLDKDDTETAILLSSTGAPIDATYITQTANSDLTAEQALSALSSGIMRVATTTGVVTSLTDSSGIASNISDETGSGALVFGTSPALSTPTGIIASDIEMGEIGTATYDDIQDWSNTTQSAGVVNGFAITDSGSGEVDIAAGQGILKTTDSVIGANVFFDYAGTTNVALTDNSINWIYIDYNAGTPQAGVTTDWTTLDLHTQVIIGKVYRMSTTVFIQETRQELDDVARRIMQMNYEKDGAIRTSGMVLGETGTRNVTVTAGVFYEAWLRLTTSAIDTSGADTFDVWNSSASTTADSTGVSQYDNDQYWTGAALASLTANRYGTRFFYLDEDGGLHMQYGTSNAVALATAENEAVPTPPTFLGDFGIYIGRIVIQKSAASSLLITSSFDLVETGQVVTDHGNLAGLADDDHTQYALLVGRSGGTTLIGGTGSGDDLTLQTTSNASKGSYIFSELTTANGLMTTDGSGVVTTTLTPSGLTSVGATTFTGALTGNASTATALQTARTIGGTSFDGTANIAIGALTSTNVGATTSAEFAGVISDETGTGVLTYATAPTFTTSIDVTGGGDIDADGVDIDASNSYAVANTDILADSAGTMTLSNVDALDATTETTIEGAIDTLSNLTTVGALNAGSITSGFTSIDTGAGNIVTTGTIGASGATLANGVVATTQSANDNSTKVATTAYADNAASGGGSPPPYFMLIKSNMFQAAYDMAKDNNGASSYSDDINYIPAKCDSAKEFGVIDSTSGGEVENRTITDDWAAADNIIGLAKIGSYLYVSATDTGTTDTQTWRFDAQDIASGGTEMTDTGMGTTALPTQMASDGTNLYFNNDGGDTATSQHIWEKWSISDTTMTSQGKITCGSTSGLFDYTLLDTSGNFYAMDGADSKVRRYNSSGTLQATQGAKLGSDPYLVYNLGDVLYEVNMSVNANEILSFMSLPLIP